MTDHTSGQLSERPGRLLGLAVGDDPAAWERAGFRVHNGGCDLGGVRIELVGTSGERGLLGWRLEGIGEPVDGLASFATIEPAVDDAVHPNSATQIDHVVAGSDDLDRTTAALAQHGIELRRTRDFHLEGVARQQRFFWLGSLILELIGRAEPTPDATGPAKLWGVALTVVDIDDTCRRLGDLASAHRAAIQPGRRISTLRGDDIGVSIPVAFMSPHTSNGEEAES